MHADRVHRRLLRGSKWANEVLPTVEDLPEGSAGPWAIKRFVVSDDDARMFNMRCFRNPDRMISPGTYTKLVHDKRGVVMSDTPAERLDHIGFVDTAEGNVLITGLGIGMVTNALLREGRHRNPVTRVTVVELDPDVIALTGPWLQAKFGDRLTIINADAYTYKFSDSVRFDYAWHDIWDSICEDNIPLYGKIRRNYQRYMSAPKRQACWSEPQARAEARESRRSLW
jgi:hypothetical protein